MGVERDSDFFSPLLVLNENVVIPVARVCILLEQRREQMIVICY